MRTTFRGREYATEGKRCLEYQQVSKLLPKEATLHALFRESQAARYQHRTKFGIDPLTVDYYLESAEVPVAPCRYMRFMNDRKAIEIFSAGTFYGFCKLRSKWGTDPGDELIGFVAGIRRPTERLLRHRLSRRLRTRDRLGIVESALFDALWSDLDIRNSFLSLMRSFEGPDDISQSEKASLARDVVSATQQRLDEVDTSVFGSAILYSSSVFDQIIDFWQNAGIEWLVARNALVEFLPD